MKQSRRHIILASAGVTLHIAKPSLLAFGIDSRIAAYDAIRLVTWILQSHRKVTLK